METFRYKAFLSYSWKDRQATEALHHALETYRPPGLAAGAPAPLRPIFRDRDEEAAGANLRDIIEDALDGSEYLVVICSPNAAASKWVNKEIAYFRKRRTPANILCYVISGDPGVDALPPALLHETTIDGEPLDGAIESPLAADARKVGDGLRLARLKIAAALLGARLDDLVRRDEARRVRRLRMLLAGASAMVVAFAGIAAFAVYQRNIAVENEARAKRETLKASRTADFMVGLFAVPDPSESRGREVTAREILDKGVASIERDLKDEPDVQANLMTTMGRSYTGLGLYPDAARILAVARDKRIETAADPADLFATENALARAEFEKGDLDAANENYAKLVKEAEDDIAKGGWRADYASALIGMGETTLYRDDPATAQKYYERARDFLAKHGGDANTIAKALQGLANAQMDQDEFESAKGNLIEALSFANKGTTAETPQKISIRNDLSYVYYRLRDVEAALKLAIDALEANREMLGDKHPETIISENNVARYTYEAGNLMQAKSMMLEVLKAFALGGREQHFDYAFPLNSAGEIYNDLGEAPAALKFLEEAATRVSDNSNRLYGPIRINLGRALCGVGRSIDGLASIAVGREALRAHYSPNDWRYAAADEFESRCLSTDGRKAEAVKLAAAAASSFLRELGPDHYFTRRAIKWRDELKGG